MLLVVFIYLAYVIKIIAGLGVSQMYAFHGHASPVFQIGLKFK
jgi:formylmethanofuran dehydrogenase subunit E